MYSGEYDDCDVTLSVYPHRASLKNIFQACSVWIYTQSNIKSIIFTLEKSGLLLDNIDIEGTRFCSEISHTRTDRSSVGRALG